MNKVLTLCVFLASLSSLNAQDNLPADSINTQINTKKSYGVIGINYSNDWVYMGRKDSIKVPYITPRASYYHKSGIYISTSLAYLVAESSNRVDLVAIRTGYDYFGKRISTGVSVVDYFYNKDSYNVQSEMTFYTSAYLGYDFDVFEAEVSGGFGFSDNTDGFVNTELNRSFYLINSNLKIVPSVRANWGTQQYYDEYYSTRSSSVMGMGSGRGKGGSGGGTTDEIMTVFIDESTKFQLLDYELAVFMIYYINNLRISFTPTYAIPVNPSKVTIDQDTFTEELDNVFFWSAGISYRF